jgi:hypothetical protein
MTSNRFKQFVYDLATLWSQYEVEIYASVIDGPMGNPSPATWVDMSMFQWARFYWESDEKYRIRPHQQSWFRMSCRKGGSKYQLFTHKTRIISLRVSELLNEYDRQEILFRRFVPITDWKPVEIKKNRIMYSHGNIRYEGHELHEEYLNRNPILFREYPPVTWTYAPEGFWHMKRMKGLMYPDAGGLVFSEVYGPIKSGEYRTPECKKV